MTPGVESSPYPFQHRHIPIDESSIHVVEAGPPQGAPFLFLHGWPESWRSFRDVMSLASRSVRAIAIDLPGIGESTGDATDGSKYALAAVVHSLIAAMKLTNVTLVGQDAGGMIAYAYLRAYRDLRRAVIMNVVLPGIDPWNEVLRNPHLWHFAMHAIPGLPERLVQGRQAEYFAYFYDGLSHDPSRITPEARAAYARAYSCDASLTAGFNWYRAFPRDTQDNERSHGKALETPLLYVRGEYETGIGAYIEGLRAAGARSLLHGVVPGAGHFAQEEAPEAAWRLIAEFAGVPPA